MRKVFLHCGMVVVFCGCSTTAPSQKASASRSGKEDASAPVAAKPHLAGSAPVAASLEPHAANAAPALDSLTGNSSSLSDPDRFLPSPAALPDIPLKPQDPGGFFDKDRTTVSGSISVAVGYEKTSYPNLRSINRAPVTGSSSFR